MKTHDVQMASSMGGEPVVYERRKLQGRS